MFAAPLRSARRCVFLTGSVTMATGGTASPPSIPRHTNRLINEKSPYLLQHAHNPVDWYPWGQEAFDKAKKENKLIFLSVGYSTCHWCHVMEEESFKNKEIGEIMSKNFVCIKVDREERPDVDKVYMTFVQATSGGGGWPMSVWLTPDLKPFAGGTYFPPEDGVHRVGFRTVLLRIAEQWKENKDSLLDSSRKILEALQHVSEICVRGQESPPPSKEVMATCFQQLSNSYDEDYGGFSKSPKFPTPVNLNFLFTYWALHRTTPEGARALQMALHTLKKMAHGGIHDHIGQGFHRYSTDQHWHVPHFEKMLYDQGQLAATYSRAFQISGDQLFADVAQDILLYVSRDLSDQAGGFYSAEDADSYPTTASKEKQEGAFCVWAAEEIQALLPDPVEGATEGTTLGDVFMHHYGVKETGNVSPMQDPHQELKGKNVLIVRCSPEVTAAQFGLEPGRLGALLQEGRQRLSAARAQRPRPHLDTKMLAAWNGLMISGFAQAGTALAKQEYVSRAAQAAAFLRRHLFDPTSGRLLRSCYRGRDNMVEQSTVPIQGFLEDYVFVIQALFDLYEASLEQDWLEWALELQHMQDKLFWDSKGFAYFSSEAGDPSLLLRLKGDQDGAEPAANSVTVTNLLRAACYSGHMEWVEKAGQILAAFSERLQKIPITLPEMARATAVFYHTIKQVIICGDPQGEDTQEMLRCVHSVQPKQGAAAGRWRRRWVPLPPVAFPCVPGEKGWQSHRLRLQQFRLLPARHLTPGAAWDALPVSPLSPLPAGRRGGDRLSHQPANAGWTHNKATLSINRLLAGSCQQRRAVPFPACSSPFLHRCPCSISAEPALVPGAGFGMARRNPLRSISYLCTRPRSSPLLDKENKLKINPSVNGEVRWENY